MSGKIDETETEKRFGVVGGTNHAQSATILENVEENAPIRVGAQEFLPTMVDKVFEKTDGITTLKGYFKIEGALYSDKLYTIVVLTKGAKKISIHGGNFTSIPPSIMHAVLTNVSSKEGLKVHKSYSPPGVLYEQYTSNETLPVQVGDPVAYGLEARTGWDGKIGSEIRLFTLRLACLNGMIAPGDAYSINFRKFDLHAWHRAPYQDRLEQLEKELESRNRLEKIRDAFEKEVEQYKEWASMKVDATLAKLLLFHLPKKYVLKYIEQKGKDVQFASVPLWDVLNEITYKLDHAPNSSNLRKTDEIKSAFRKAFNEWQKIQSGELTLEDVLQIENTKN